MTTKRFHRVALGLALALTAATCGGADGVSDADTTAATPTPATTSTVSITTTAPSTTTTTSLAGEPIDFGPEAGDVLSVIGVRYDDVLNVRAGPGTDQPIVATLPPTSERAVATGRTRALPRSFWTEVTVDGVTGWASLAFLAYRGLTDDITSQVMEELGEIPTAETMKELGMIVAGTQASHDPASKIVVVKEARLGDLGEIVIDVVGLGDDALRGLRLHVFGQPMEGGDGFSLKSVEATLLCGRGVTDDGVCV